MAFSAKFRETFREIFEKSVLALWLTGWALIGFLAHLACSAFHAPKWLMLLVDVIFATIAIADALAIICLTVALLIRLMADTFHEIKSIITGK